MRVRREGRELNDGFVCGLVPGIRASEDARRLAREIAFSSARLDALSERPPGTFGEAAALASADPERATWICFLTAYLSPLEGEDPFAGIRTALARSAPDAPCGGELPDLDGVPLGPRTSHDSARGAETLLAYRQWIERAAGEDGRRLQAVAFTGERSWAPERRFERDFERLSLPGFARMGRYELLVVLGRLGIYELRADSLHLGGGGGASSADPAPLAAKRVFAIGDAMLLERRARALADAVGVRIEALDLALANWASGERASGGFPPELNDAAVLERAGEALGL